MAVYDPEGDIETAIATVIAAQLVTDGIAGVTVSTFTGGASGDEPIRPYIYVVCRPLSHVGAGTDQWIGEAAVHCYTKHLTGHDRDATGLVQLRRSVGYALDYGAFSGALARLGSVALRRNGGDYTIADSENVCTIDVSIIKACGSK